MATVVTTQRIGRDGNPPIVIDRLAADPERVSMEAFAARHDRDGFTADRIALLHFLCPEASDDGGTGFYRHRSTGCEWVDGTRAPVFFGQLEAKLRRRGVPERHIHGDTDLFEHIAHVPADAATGRLTVTAFLSTAAAPGEAR